MIPGRLKYTFSNYWIHSKCLLKAGHFSLRLRDTPMRQMLLGPSQAGSFHLPPTPPPTLLHPMPCPSRLCFCPLLGLRQWRPQRRWGSPWAGYAPWPMALLSPRQPSLHSSLLVPVPGPASCPFRTGDAFRISDYCPSAISLPPACLCKQFLYENSSDYSNSKEFP